MAKKIVATIVAVIMCILLVFLAGCGDSNGSRWMSAEKFEENKSAIGIETRESWHILNNKSADVLREHWGEIFNSYINVSFSQEEGAKIEFIALIAASEGNYKVERRTEIESEYATQITLAILGGVSRMWVGDENDGFMLYIPEYLRECSFEYNADSEQIVLIRQ